MRALVTIRDVAASAGVSSATVSRALSSAGAASVRPKTREAVLRAASELDYKPSSLPGQLRHGRSEVFGVVVGDIENPFYMAVVKAFEQEAHAHGLGPVLVNTDEDPLREADALEVLGAQRVAGVALAGSSVLPAGVARLTAFGIPVVTFDNRVQGAALDSVTVNNRASTRWATQYLQGLGHRWIGMISGPLASSSIRGSGSTVGECHGEPCS